MAHGIHLIGKKNQEWYASGCLLHVDLNAPYGVVPFLENDAQPLLDLFLCTMMVQQRLARTIDIFSALITDTIFKEIIYIDCFEEFVLYSNRILTVTVRARLKISSRIFWNLSQRKMLIKKCTFIILLLYFF